MGQVFRDSHWDRNHVVSRLLEGVKLPSMVRIRQNFDQTKIEDLPAAIHDALSQEKICRSIRPGMRIAITAGSRGTDRYPEEMCAIVSELKALGADPFLIPAMGSHGGGTAEGQALMLQNLGITEETVGAPIRATMEVVQIGSNMDGYPVYIDKYAAEADGIVIVNRIKPHTNFRGEYESGLMKMMTIGLGKNVGAATCHRLPMDDMSHNVFAFGSAVLKHANVLFGLATLENPLDKVRRVIALTPEEIPEQEKLLQAEAKMSMPRLPADEFDVLIVDQIGKNFSGPGMDPNVTGISGNPHLKLKPDVQRRVVLDVSDESHGNATGIGLADFSTKRAFDKIDFDAGYANNITSRSLAGGRIPIILQNDLLAIRAALYTCDGIRTEEARLMRIPNTLHIGEIEVSTALLPTLSATACIEILTDPYVWNFDADGNLF
ncbi:protein of unknown function [Oscillibacter sp. PC13]|uniref:lactate racemase domain-containing protein n=1 Tax=Oscillibacter sp. PC13 TaxID=1855299 RepID=UPI0008EE42E1|nr:lactate racemase domain-containing protein [Oscillibacter sp. PC13]SFP36987.1 protein of unknown function [Oscillibacter sp. PC13]